MTTRAGRYQKDNKAIGLLFVIILWGLIVLPSKIVMWLSNDRPVYHNQASQRSTIHYVNIRADAPLAVDDAKPDEDVNAPQSTAADKKIDKRITENKPVTESVLSKPTPITKEPEQTIEAFDPRFIQNDYLELEALDTDNNRSIVFDPQRRRQLNRYNQSYTQTIESVEQYVDGHGDEVVVDGERCFKVTREHTTDQGQWSLPYKCGAAKSHNDKLIEAFEAELKRRQ